MNLSNPVNLLIAGVYYALVAVLTFFAIFGVYILIRYGRSTPAAVLTYIIFAFMLMNILNQSHQILAGILAA